MLIHQGMATIKQLGRIWATPYCQEAGKGKRKSLKEFRAPKKTGWNWFILKESGLERLKTVVWKKKNVSQRKTVF